MAGLKARSLPKPTLKTQVDAPFGGGGGAGHDTNTLERVP